MKVVNRNIEVKLKPSVLETGAELTEINNEDGVSGLQIYKLPAMYKESGNLTITWKMPAINVAGSWTSNSLYNKRIYADWEMPQLQSRISVDTPILSLFNLKDENVATISCSDALNTVLFEASYREEDDHIHFKIHFHSERSNFTQDEILLRIDKRPTHFSKAIKEASAWIDEKLGHKLAPIPEHARLPVYSTWYSYHQDFAEKDLVRECKIASKLGYKVIIVDDGWQTMDDNRGYDYTGDWFPKRISGMTLFKDKVHSLDMKLMLWYSVPFCGKKSQAYQRFRGKFLTEKHPWAPVFDPRFTEVREYLVGKYLQAVSAWGIDGLKLDFIDDFKVYPETEVNDLEGRDTLSVNDGVQKLLSLIRSKLCALKPDLLIEFRQRYIGPYLRTAGNMFRAFDCPGDSVMNRVRTSDLKLIAGDAAVHSDMITWNSGEDITIAACQYTSILFSVPQISVKLDTLPPSHYASLKFFTDYWLQNRHILLNRNFKPYKPLANYPVLKSYGRNKVIYGLYDDYLLVIDSSYDQVDIINGKLTEKVILDLGEEEFHWNVKVFSCTGMNTIDYDMKGIKGLYQIESNINGIIQLTKKY